MYELDKEQKLIVDENESCLIIAGAGSGKTLTLISKIIKLLNDGVKQEDILVLAYTRNSAKEIEQRLFKMGYQFKVYTFHSLAYEIVKPNNILTDGYFKFFYNEFIQSEVYNTYTFAMSNIEKKKLFDLLPILSEQLEINESKLTFIQRIKYSSFIKFIKFYTNEYKQFKNNYDLIDFRDLINIATYMTETNYKYILVDEYQDISIERFNFLQKLVKIGNSKLFCFGDDYQSIFRFSGSRVELFVEFEKYTNIYNKRFILKTYRNSNELVSIMNKFMLKNKNQIRKDLISDKNIDYPLVISTKKYEDSFDYIFSDINNEKDILILARYNKNKNILVNFFNYSNGYYYYKNYLNKCTFMTVHKSKGLEATNVIVIELNDERFGFPTKIKEDKFYLTLLNTKEKRLDEERRLLYVAITRTKNKTYLISNKKKSVFIKELLKDKRVLLIR